MRFVVEMRDIRKSFGGVAVLHGVDLRVGAGEVLALLGENGAGKSTLIKVLAGDHRPDSGEIRLGDALHHGLSPRQARELGISVIFQEFQDAADLSVAENISLGQLPLRRGLVDRGRMRSQAAALLADLGVDVDPDLPVGALRVGERQVVEIARSLSRSTRLLVLDEPTASLSHHETERLFGFVRRLRDQGVAVVYITHRLDEVEALADRVQVLRDGRTALDAPVASASRREVVAAMIGTSVADVRRPDPTEARGEPVLQWRAAAVGEHCVDVDLSVRAGEVVGLYGKIGSGAAELAETAFGLRPLTAGSLLIDGTARTLSSPRAAIAAGIGFLPAERKAGGAFLTRTVAENICVASWSALARAGVLRERDELGVFERWRSRLGIRSSGGGRQPMGTLSGGNQQKVLLARWLEAGVRALVLVEPTRGVDVGARAEIYATLRGLARSGTAVLVVTSDYEEAFQLADHVCVLTRGRVTARLAGDDVTTSTLVTASGG